MKYDNTITLIGKIKELAGDVIVKELEELGITGLVPSHGSIIMTLAKNNELTMSQIAEKIAKDPSTVTTLVKKLIKLGYVSKKKNYADQRSSLVFLTPKGKDVEKEIVRISEKLYDIQYEGISEDEVEVFRGILNRVCENFGRSLDKN